MARFKCSRAIDAAVALVVLGTAAACGTGSIGGRDAGEEPGTDSGGGDTSSTSDSGPMDGDSSLDADTGPIDPDAWVAPIGIPEPDFGIHEQAPVVPSPWSASTAGFYYVDNAHLAATDHGNPYGTPAQPRATVPGDVPAGAVVEVHGGPYEDETLWSASATREHPVFFRGTGLEDRPIFRSAVEIQGSYVIVENIDFEGPDTSVSVLTPSDHVAVRHCEVHGGVGGPSAGMYTGRWNPEDDPSEAHHVVFFDNRVYDNGDWQATFDEDHHGFAIGHHASYVWVLNNTMFHNSGDGLQINAKKAYLMPTLHHIYVGGNVAYENKQTGLWTKQAQDVIFSQNVTYGLRPSGSSGGSGLGWQYGPERVWFLFNHVYDCENGIKSSTFVGDEDDVAGPGQDIYMIGNVIHGIHKTEGAEDTGDPWQYGAGLLLTDQEATKHIVNNTIYDTDVAISYARGTGPLEIANNLLADMVGRHVHIETDEAAVASQLHHTLFDVPAIIDWQSAVYDLSGFRAAFAGQCTGCIEGAPLFVDPSGGDFHQSPESPGVNAGAESDAYALFFSLYGVDIRVDPDRVARPQGGAMDMGAFER